MIKKFPTRLEKCQKTAGEIFFDSHCIYSSLIIKDPEVLTKAFVVYLRPILEYSSPVWSPSAVTYINKLESVQRSFTTRKLCYRKDDRAMRTICCGDMAI